MTENRSIISTGALSAAGVTLLSAVSFSALSPSDALAQTASQPPSVVCTVEMVAMRDGKKLATEVYRPAAAGKYPVIVQRTPYNGGGLGGALSNCDQPAVREWALKGYVAINQDVRGTHRSEGVLNPVLQEGNDGYDTVEWAAKQPWSTGKVGMTGASYVGITQWQAAIKRPPHLVTIVPEITSTRFDQAWPYQGAFFGKLIADQWTAIMQNDQLRRKLRAQGVAEDQIALQVATVEKESQAKILQPVEQNLPRVENRTFVNDLSPWYKAWLEHPTLDAYWEPANVQDKFSLLSIPVLNLGSVYDLWTEGTINGFTGMKRESATQESRNSARLVLAGGGHASGLNDYVGDLTFGPDNRIPSDLRVRWFDYWLKGIDNGVMKGPAVQIFVVSPPDQGSVGSGFWVTGDTFPLPGTRDVKFYPDGGKANTFNGFGKLATATSSAPGTDQFDYDPAHPVPTLGGSSCCIVLPNGVHDQRPAEMRPDVLVYTSAPLTEALTVVGAPTVTIVASSSAPRTSFTAKLVDVRPSDGYAAIITDGIVEASGTAPGSKGTYTIRLNSTSAVFKPGHRIRLDISSSNYPRYDVHSNTDEPLATAKDIKVAKQTIFWGGESGTALSLPVIPNAAPRAANP